MSTRDRYDYIGRMRERRLGEAVRERRFAAVKAVSRFRVQVTQDGQSVDTLDFDAPPTLADLVAASGEDAYILSVERLHHSQRDTGSAEPMAAE